MLFCHLSIWNCRLVAFRAKQLLYQTILTTPSLLFWTGCSGSRAALRVVRAVCHFSAPWSCLCSAWFAPWSWWPPDVAVAACWSCSFGWGYGNDATTPCSSDHGTVLLALCSVVWAVLCAMSEVWCDVWWWWRRHSPIISLYMPVYRSSPCLKCLQVHVEWSPLRVGHHFRHGLDLYHLGPGVRKHSHYFINCLLIPWWWQLQSNCSVERQYLMCKSFMLVHGKHRLKLTEITFSCKSVYLR